MSEQQQHSMLDNSHKDQDQTTQRFWLSGCGVRIVEGDEEGLRRSPGPVAGASR